jgi:hypothetical protein
MAGSSFGVGFPMTYPASQLSPFGIAPYAPYGGQAVSSNPFVSQQYGQPLQQIFQLLQIVPHQLQHLQQLASIQQQQLQQLLQTVQLLLQQPSQLQQPFGQVAGLGGFAATPPWGIPSQPFSSQPGHVM